eukprot:COSAG05_NODE_1098_length_5892_cov_50.569480_6_plen_316_part_01
MQGEDTHLLNSITAGGFIMVLNSLLSLYEVLYGQGWKLLAFVEVLNLPLMVLMLVGATFCLILGSDAATDPVYELMLHAFDEQTVRLQLWQDYCSASLACQQFATLAVEAIGSASAAFPQPNITVAAIFSNCTAAGEYGGELGAQSLAASRVELLGACEECTTQCRSWVVDDIKGNLMPANVLVYVLLVVVSLAMYVNHKLIGRNEALHPSKCCGYTCADAFAQPSILRCNAYGLNILVVVLGMGTGACAYFGEQYLETQCAADPSVDCPSSTIDVLVFLSAALVFLAFAVVPTPAANSRFCLCTSRTQSRDIALQ